MEKCIILTGGGTAGHTTVNIKLKDELSKHFNKIIYIGSENGIEKQLIQSQTNYTYIPITTTKLSRGKIFSNLSIPFKLKKGTCESYEIIKKYKPKVIFSKGGYVGLPVTIAGKKLGIPVICHESDLTMGLANKLAKKHAKIICTNFEITANIDKNKCIYTGMPLILSQLSRDESKQKLHINSNKPLLLVTGGSLGAKILNNFVFNNLESLTKNFNIFHITGKGNLNKKIMPDLKTETFGKTTIYKTNINQSEYFQVEFFNDMPTLFKACDFALSRAGANTCLELLSNNILTIFVPLENKNSRGDQIENANYLKSKNLCSVIYQKNLNIENFNQEINYLKKNSQQIKKNIKKSDITDGTRKIMSIILNNQLP